MPDNATPSIDLELEPAAGGQQPTAPQAPTIPDKYRNKSLEDLIQMHQNAERRLSQQGNELGEMRRIADGLIGIKKQENVKTAPVERKPVTVDSLLNNPEQALTQTIEQSTVAQRADAVAQRVETLENSIARNAFESRFKSHQEDMQNPEFIEWVKKNNTRRALAGAAYQGNYQAASELWEMWDEVRGTTPAAPQARDPKQAAQAARVMRSAATDGQDPKRVYSRAKLMALRERVADGDPSAQAQWANLEFQQALIEAYAEGRVR